MQNIRQLDHKNLRKFRDFVHSPFFNKHKLTTQLFDILYEKVQKNGSLEKQEIFEMLFPNEPYEAFKLQNLMSYLMELLNQFLAQLTYQKKETHWIDNLEAAYELNLLDLLAINFRKAKTHLRKRNIQDEQHYFVFSKMNEIYDSCLDAGQKKKNSQFLRQSISHLDQYYLLQKLKYVCQVLSWSKGNNEGINLTDFYDLAKKIEDNRAEYDANKLIKTYYHILMIWLEKDEEIHYAYLLKKLKKEAKTYNPSELAALYSYTTSYATLQFNKGHEHYLPILFNLYKQAIDHKVIINKGKVHEGTYQNIINLACRLKEFSWAMDFLESHRKYLVREQESNAYHFNLSNILFNQGDFEAALNLLQDIKFTNSFYQNNTKIIQLKCYYELEKDLLLLSFLDSYRLYLLRSKEIPKARQKICRHFMKMVQQLVKFQDKKITLSRRVFLSEIQQFRDALARPDFMVINKAWLLEKTDLLIND